MTEWITTLAARDWVEPVIYGIGTIILVGGWIANSIKQAKEQREIAQRRREQREQTQHGRQTTTAQRQENQLPSHDQIAQRRREQLAALRGARTDQDRDTADRHDRQREPENLTAAQAVERRRARERYQQRADQLREQREADQRRRQRETDEQRRSQQRQQQLELQHRREQAEQTRQQRQAQQRQRAAAQRQPQAPARPTVSATAPITTPGPVSTAPDHYFSSISMRTVGSAHFRSLVGTPTKKPLAVASIAGPLNRKSLRRAVILREILSTPTALRDPLQDQLWQS